MPARVFTAEQVAAKGQHYIVHFSSRSGTDGTYTDAMDLHALLEDVVDPKEPDNALPGLIYGATTGDYSWSKTDHCQFVEPEEVTSPVRDATDDVQACHADQTDANMNRYALITSRTDHYSYTDHCSH